MSNILCLSPHTDDVELGMGGTVSRLVREGHKIFYIAFSDAKKSIPEGFPEDTLIKECTKASKILNIHHLEILDFPVREFNGHRQKILDCLLKYKKDIDPKIVFLPCSSDTHQDHYVVYCEGLRAFKDRTVYGYELPWNNIDFKSRAFFILQEEDVKKKEKAFKCYKSQNVRVYYKEHFIKNWIQLRGAQIGKDFAECFEVIREVN
jgi:LmbE family N-acetylglucosaminyl deacetylase